MGMGVDGLAWKMKVEKGHERGGYVDMAVLLTSQLVDFELLHTCGACHSLPACSS